VLISLANNEVIETLKMNNCVHFIENSENRTTTRDAAKVVLIRFGYSWPFGVEVS
jgi:hypothetical protein